jgi:hypothetical protein
MIDVLKPRARFADASRNTVLAIVLSVLMLSTGFIVGYRIGFEDGHFDGVAAGRAAAPAAKSDFQLCMDRMDRDFPTATTTSKVVRCKPQ